MSVIRVHVLSDTSVACVYMRNCSSSPLFTLICPQSRSNHTCKRDSGVVHHDRGGQSEKHIPSLFSDGSSLEEIK